MSDLLLNLQTFVRVAERLSFSAVADQSHASHTTIARRIGQLEEHFGIRLFQRSTRRLLLTREGERLLDHARRLVMEMENIEAELAGTRAVRGVVRIGVTTALGLHYADRLGALTGRHPDLRVEFAVADWQDSLVESGVDLALHVGDPAPEALGIVPLGLVFRRLVAAPSYVAEHGAPRMADDLRRHQCITYGYGAMPAVWEVDGTPLRVGGCFRANSSEAVLRAVLSGLGIGLLPAIQISAAIAEARLVPILPEASISPLVLSVRHRFDADGLPERVRAVLDFLVDEFPSPSEGNG